MRLLLTSAGIKNASIHDALVDLLGKPIPESNALCIPTATHALAQPELTWRFISGQEPRTRARPSQTRPREPVALRERSLDD